MLFDARCWLSSLPPSRITDRAFSMPWYPSIHASIDRWRSPTFVLGTALLVGH
jgi:hypothetical protein